MFRSNGSLISTGTWRKWWPPCPCKSLASLSRLSNTLTGFSLEVGVVETCSYTHLFALSRVIWTNFSLLFLDIEFNLTGSYGSPVHTNHNSNYSSMPSPDMDQSDRKQQHDQSRRPLSVATDNMMLEFYKKDGWVVPIRSVSSVSPLFFCSTTL